MNSLLPRMRLVALSTASAAARAGSVSVSTEPTTRWSELSPPVVARETMTTVASNARTALTPSSSKLEAALSHRLAQGLDAGLGGATKFTGLRGQPLALPAKRLRIAPRQAHLRTAAPVGQAIQHELGEAQALAERVRGSHDRPGEGEFRDWRQSRRRGKAYATPRLRTQHQPRRSARAAARTSLESFSAWAKRAALEAAESG